MKILAAFLCLVLCLSCNDKNTASNLDKRITANASLFGYYHGFNDKDCSIDYYLINLTITNSCDSIIRFWTYSCFINGNILVSDSSYSIIYNSCDANFPDLIELKPLQSLIMPIMLLNTQASKSNWPLLKIGFVLVFENQHNIEMDLRESIENYISTGTQTIWSNNINFSYDVKKPYRIE